MIYAYGTFIVHVLWVEYIWSITFQIQEFEGKDTALLIDRYKYADLFPCSQSELKALGYHVCYHVYFNMYLFSIKISWLNVMIINNGGLIIILSKSGITTTI